MTLWVSKRNRLLTGISVLFLFVSVNSCKKASPTQAQTTPPQQGSADSTSFGTISFVPDYSQTDSASLDTSAVEISTTDADGIRWDLIVPQQDFVIPTTISITPIENVKSDSTYDITNGVVFGPDGFQFSSPAVLTVTIPASSEPYAFYLFNHDGKVLDFASAADTGGVYKITITHFSGAAAAHGFDPAAICKKATAEYQGALDEAKQVLAQDPVVPVPPDIDLDCGMNASKKETALEYYAEFKQPEDSLARKLAGALSTMQMLNCSQDAQGTIRLELTKLGDHLFQKGQDAYSQYQGDDKKYIAVTRAMVTATAFDELMGGPGSNSDQTMSEIASWVKNFFDDEMNKLTQSHDYKAISAFYPLIYDYGQFANGDIGSLWRQVQAALTFKFELDETLTEKTYFPELEPDTILAGTVVIHGDITVKPNIPARASTTHWTGTGSIDYVSGITLDACQNFADTAQGGHDKLVTPQSFPLTVRVDSVDPCGTGEMVISFDTLGSTLETWDYGYDIQGAYGCSNGDNSDQANSGNYQWTFSNNMLTFQNQGYYDLYADRFTFHLPIQSNDPVAVDKTYDVHFGAYVGGSDHLDMYANLEVKMIHTPQ